CSNSLLATFRKGEEARWIHGVGHYANTIRRNTMTFANRALEVFRNRYEMRGVSECPAFNNLRQPSEKQPPRPHDYRSVIDLEDDRDASSSSYPRDGPIEQ